MAECSGATDLTPLPKDLVATEIFDHAARGRFACAEILNRSAQTLAYAIYNLAVVLNCPLFVLGGSVGMHPVFWNVTQEILEQRDKRVQPKLLRSTLGSDAQVNGAICLAIEAAGSRVLSS